MIQIVGKTKKTGLVLYNKPKITRKYIEFISEHEN
jgi:hypothetical protein